MATSRVYANVAHLVSLEMARYDQMTLCGHADGGSWTLLAPAKQMVNRLRVNLHDEGGSPIQQLQHHCQVECGWAMRHRMTGQPGSSGSMLLRSMQVPAADVNEQHHTIKLFQNNLSDAVHSISLRVQPVPKQHKQPKVRHSPVTLGEPFAFNLMLQDAHGHSIPEPARWFQIQQATVQLPSTQQLDCKPQEGDCWAQVLDVSHLGDFPLGPLQLQLKFKLVPKHWQLQQYETGSPLHVQCPCKVDIRAGRASKLVLTADDECKELSLLNIGIQAEDSAGNPTALRGKGITFTARLGLVSATFTRATDRPGHWSGQLCAAVEPGRHSLTIHCEGNDVILPLPQPHDVQVVRAGFFNSLSLKPVDSMSFEPVQAGTELSLQVTLNPVQSAYSTPTLSARHRAGLKVALTADGCDKDHPSAELTEQIQSGLTFVFGGHAPCRAGTFLLRASWTETRRDQVQAFENAEAAGQTDLEALGWQHLKESINIEVLPGPIDALAVCPVEQDAGTTIMMGEDLPGLCVRFQDQHGNSVPLSQPVAPCRMGAAIVRASDCDDDDLRIPTLANGATFHFEAAWDHSKAAFCLPEAALKVTQQQLGNGQAVAAHYQLQLLDPGPLQDLKGAWPFTYSDQFSQKREHAAAQETVKQLGAQEKSLDKVYSALHWLCPAHRNTKRVILLQNSTIPKIVEPHGNLHSWLSCFLKNGYT